MKELAYKIIGMDTLWDEAIECDDMDMAMELELEIALNAGMLARLVAEMPRDEGPLAPHTRRAEIVAYATKREMCLEHAIVELVNAALAHLDDYEESEYESEDDKQARLNNRREV
jgi:hypothetical protein